MVLCVHAAELWADEPPRFSPRVPSQPHRSALIGFGLSSFLCLVAQRSRAGWAFLQRVLLRHRLGGFGDGKS